MALYTKKQQRKAKLFNKSEMAKKTIHLIILE
jgi:hypothetical protein